MRTGPCAFDPAASPQPCGPSASCLFNSPHSLSSYSPLPWVDYGSKAKALLGGCLISKPVWQKMWGMKRKEAKKQQLLCRLTSSSVTAHWSVLFCLHQMFLKNVIYSLLKSLKGSEGFRSQLIGFAYCGLGIKKKKTFIASKWSL